VDVLMRNTTWSVRFGWDDFTGLLSTTQGSVPADSGIDSLDDLEGGTVCVQKGTTTELNLADAMATAGVSYTPAVFDDVNATYGAYGEGRCDAATSDKSQLVSVAKGLLPDPDNHVLLDLTLSKDLGPRRMAMTSGLISFAGIFATLPVRVCISANAEEMLTRLRT
jgi:general L-amino acid transport system substrate-binding protein